jgi:hypothetical protein
VARRLLEDFPALSQTRVVMCLSNPEYISNVRSVHHMLKDSDLAGVFSGITLWDLDYYDREMIPG